MFYNIHKNVIYYGSIKNLYGNNGKFRSKDPASLRRKCILLPDSKFRTSWTVIIIVLLVYTAIFVPFRLAFIEEDSLPLTIVEATVDILFGIDIYVNFISAIEGENNQLITDHRTIACTYLKGWFWLDLLACFPFNYIEFGAEEGGSNSN